MNDYPPLRWSHKRLMKEYGKQSNEIAGLKRKIDQLEQVIVVKVKLAADAYREVHGD